MIVASQQLHSLGGHGLQLQVGPFVVRLRSDIPEVGEHIQRVYGEFPASEGTGGHFDLTITHGSHVRRWVRRQAFLTVGGTRAFLPLPARLAGPFFDWGLNWCVGQTAHQWVALHSAVLERGGYAVIMPAAPGSGKSTLCAALAHSGWRFFSDEFALIDPDTLQVRALPRPISLKERSIDVIRERYPGVVMTNEAQDIEDVRFVHARPPTESVRRADEEAIPRWIIFPKYSVGAATTIEPLPKAECLIELTDQSFNYNYLGTRGFMCLVNVVKQCDCYTLTYSDLDDVIVRIDELTAR